MRISELDVIPIALPFRDRYRTASGELTERVMAVILLRTTAGAVGLGEAVPLSLRGGASLERITAELGRIGTSVLRGADLSPAESGDPEEITVWIEAVLAGCAGAGAGPQSLAGIDIALHDLAGKLSGLPAWRLLGAAAAAGVICNASIDAADPGRAGAEAARLAEAGFETFKVKVGAGDDRGRIAAVREAIGPEPRLRIDANGAWSLAEATATLEDYDAAGIELAEQPCSGLEDLASLRARTTIPIVADESVASVADGRRAVQLAACDAATVKLAKVGGPREALRLSGVIPSYLSSALDGPIGIAAALHTAQALPATDLAHGLATLAMFSTTYAPIEGLWGPALEPPEGPGLGVELDPDRLEQVRLR